MTCVMVIPVTPSSVSASLRAVNLAWLNITTTLDSLTLADTGFAEG